MMTVGTGKWALPARKLTARPVQQALTSSLIVPVLHQGWRVSAFRLSWIKQDDLAIQNIWDQIVQWRTMLDKMLSSIMGIRIYLSAITATQSTQSSKDTKAQYRVHPGMAYWVAADSTVFDERQMFSHMQGNRFGATMKPLLQPYQQSKADICNAAFTVVKDNVEGTVRRMVDASTEFCLGTEAGEQHPIVKICVLDEDNVQLGKLASDNLTAAKFPVQLVVPETS